MLQIKLLISFSVCLSFFSLHISAEKSYQVVLDKMKEMEKNNGNINGVYKPSKDGYLGQGIFGVTYKGTMIPARQEVAMKFTDSSNEQAIENAAREYAIYSYLNAINNTKIEAYGIPSIYYYGRWDEYILMALTLLDTTVKMKSNSNNPDELDVLIIFREFVRISKYIHSRGIFHNDIKLDNMMFRRSQGFIIDFNIAKKMNRHAQEDERRFTKNDWNRFFNSMCQFIGVAWFGFKNEHNEIMSKGIKSDAMRRVFVEFANNISDDNINKQGVPILNYDRTYQIICEEIDRIQSTKPAFVSWIKNEDKRRAIQELAIIPKISSINDPFGIDEPQYSEVNFNYFYQHKEHISVDKAFERAPLVFTLGASSENSGTNYTKVKNRFRKSFSLKYRR